MRIAISGTHCCGKSTLVDEFLDSHPDFVREPESYEVLQEEHGEVFAAEPSAEDFCRLLEYSVGRLQEYTSEDKVIFERCPADYLAYLLALADLGRNPTAKRMTENLINVARQSLQQLDIIVLLRPNDRLYELPEEEDVELRNEVEKRLEKILVDNALDLLTGDQPLLVEATGSTLQRMESLEAALARWLNIQRTRSV